MEAKRDLGDPMGEGQRVRGGRFTAETTEQRYRLLFERNPQPMWVFDKETLRFLAVNAAAVKHYGYSREEFLAMTIYDIRPEEEVPALDLALDGPADADAFGRWHHRLADGSLIDVMIFADDLPFDGRPGRLVLAVDVTAQRQAEEAQRRAYEDTLRRLTKVVESRDVATGVHVARIGEIVALLAGWLGLPPNEVALLRAAAPMHDLGKVGLPDAILLKPDELTPEERRVMETHAEIGHRLLSGSDAELLELAATIALTHHERFDGSGYPRGLAGEEIPFEGRLVAVADVFDALTSDRVYRPAFSPEEALEVMGEGKFDPRILSVLVDHLDEVIAATGAGPAG